jgi:hypothetical protein
MDALRIEGTCVDSQIEVLSTALAAFGVVEALPLLKSARSLAW